MQKNKNEEFFKERRLLGQGIWDQKEEQIENSKDLNNQIIQSCITYIYFCHSYNVITIIVILYLQNVPNQAFFLFLFDRPNMQLESCEIKHFSSTEENPCYKTSQKKYVKITEEVKETFLKFIIESNMSIKKASEALRINYSSAKAILSAHKKTIRISKTETVERQETSSRSSYKAVGLLNSSKSLKLTVSCSVGGKSIVSREIPKTKLIFKPQIIVPIRECME